MTQQSTHPFTAFSKTFADSAAKIQSLALEGVASVSQLQVSEFGHQAKASQALCAEALALREAAEVPGLVEKAGSLGRDSVERHLALSQEIVAITQKTVASITALLQAQREAVNDAVVAPIRSAKKATGK